MEIGNHSSNSNNTKGEKDNKEVVDQGEVMKEELSETAIQMNELNTSTSKKKKDTQKNKKEGVKGDKEKKVDKKEVAKKVDKKEVVKKELEEEEQVYEEEEEEEEEEYYLEEEEEEEEFLLQEEEEEEENSLQTTKFGIKAKTSQTDQLFVPDLPENSNNQKDSNNGYLISNLYPIYIIII